MLSWVCRAVPSNIAFQALRNSACIRAGIIRNMAFSIEERGSLNDFDYRVYFSEFTCMIMKLLAAELHVLTIREW